MDHHLLALDLDGTVVNFDGQISLAVKEEIRRVAAQGTQIIIATGRAHSSALVFASELGLQVPMILLQGGLVVNERGETWRRLLLEPTIVQEVIPWAERYDLGLVLFSGDQTFADRYRLAPEQYHAFFSNRLHMVDDLAEKAHGLLDKVILVGTESSCDAAFPYLQARFGERAEITRSWRHFLEVTPRGATKGAALAWVAARFGVERENVIAVGDALNDLSMLVWAGVGVAMGDYEPALCQVADLVVPGVEEDGLVVALRRYFPLASSAVAPVAPAVSATKAEAI